MLTGPKTDSMEHNLNIQSASCRYFKMVGALICAFILPTWSINPEKVLPVRFYAYPHIFKLEAKLICTESPFYNNSVCTIDFKLFPVFQLLI